MSFEEEHHATTSSATLSWRTTYMQDAVLRAVRRSRFPQTLQLQEAFRITGDLNLGRFRKVLGEVVSRHPILTADFAVAAEEGVVRSGKHAIPFALEEIDLRDLPAASRTTQLGEFAFATANKPFNLACEPPLRAAILKLDSRDHVLLLTASRVAVDHESLELLIREVGETYLRESPLPPEVARARYHYRESASGRVDVESHLAAWRNQLARAPRTRNSRTPADADATDSGKPHRRRREAWLALPFERPPTPDAPALAIRRVFECPPSLKSGLDELSGNMGIAPAVVALAAYKGFIHRYTGQSTIVLGAQIANRGAGDERTIGPFANTLPVVTEVNGEESFGNLTTRVAAALATATTHGKVLLDDIVADLRLEADDDLSPLFTLAFAYQSEPTLSSDWSDLRVSALALPRVVSPYRFAFALRMGTNACQFRIDWNPSSFNEADVIRFAKNFETFLAGTLAEPHRPLWTIPMLHADERQLLIEGWNNTARGLDARCVHAMFAAQAQRSPGAIAVACDRKKWSYRQLNSLATQFALHLRQHGVGAGNLVGVSLDRSSDMMVALLGVLMAGATYVPLDPAYPPERLKMVMSDCGAAFLVTETGLVEDIAGPNVKRIDLNIWMASRNADTDIEPWGLPSASFGDLAYVIYTSGSTGKPKGVAISHSSVANFIASMRREPGIDAGDRLLAVTTLSFDIAVLELFVPLTVGATVVIASSAAAANGARLIERMDEVDATVLQATPVTWRLLIASGWKGKPNLRMLCGGERLTRELAADLLAKGAELWNMYGPTETTVWSSVQKISSVDEPIVVGRPIDNTTMYILDSHKQLVPIGTQGDLYIGGMGLSPGYLNRPDLTADRFFTDPFLQSDTARIYNTGDVARFLPNGSIEHLGRSDHQVKVRGFRIELGEIESVLAQYPSVRETVVLARDDGSGEKRLVAYVVLHGGSEVEGVAARMRGHLSQRLPAHMVPVEYVKLDAFPLTPNLKIDRRALAGVSGLHLDLETTSAPARNETEAKIADLFASTLKVRRVGVDDSFLDLGGNSLTLTRLVARIGEVFNVEIPLKSAFQNTTVAKLARIVEAVKNETIIEDDTSANDFARQAGVDARLADDIPIPPRNGSRGFTPPRSILLTGATGFLGSHLLADLLDGTDAIAHCVVRAETEEAAFEKLEQARSRYTPSRAFDKNRIRIVLGDLSRARLGMPEAAFDGLAKAVDSIIHCGAHVNHAYAYADVRAANVLSIRDILLLATTETVKPIHYISSGGIFRGGNQGRSAVLEDDDVAQYAQYLTRGYHQSKLVAERILTSARSRGFPAAIYRPAYIGGDSVTGIAPTHDTPILFLKVCVDLKLAPAVERMVDITPVDFVSKAVVALSRQPQSLEKTFHLYNGARMSIERLVSVVRNLGYEIETTSVAEWLSAMRVQKSNETVAAFVAAGGDKWLAEEVVLDCGNTNAALEGTTVKCPPLDAVLLRRYVDYFTKVGFLPAPSRPPRR